MLTDARLRRRAKLARDGKPRVLAMGTPLLEGILESARHKTGVALSSRPAPHLAARHPRRVLLERSNPQPPGGSLGCELPRHRHIPFAMRRTGDLRLHVEPVPGRPAVPLQPAGGVSEHGRTT